MTHVLLKRSGVTPYYLLYLEGKGSHMGGTNRQWELGNFLGNATSSVQGWIALAVTLVGIIAVGYAIWIIVTGLMSQGKKQTNWAIAIILLLVGGALSATGGFGFVQRIARSGQATIGELGSGTIVMDYLTMLPF